ncbi:MAG: 4Fe-4S dicluster domain-containing protein [Thermoanaerobaculales bacterium]
MGRDDAAGTSSDQRGAVTAPLDAASCQVMASARLEAGVAARSPLRVDSSLLSEVQRLGKFDTSCLNCGGCSVACELALGDVTFPRKPIRHVVLGLREAVVAGLEPWLCHDCGDCSLKCPRQADPAASMRTLRRYLTGEYDWTGLSARILRSRAWHLGSLLAVGAVVLALVVAYHLRWVGLSVPDFVATPMGIGHMFPKILYFTWLVYALPAIVLVTHVWRMYRLTMGRTRPAPRHLLAEARTLMVHMLTHRQLRKCPSEARGAPVVGWWLYAGSAEAVPRRWLKHWLMALGTVLMFVLTVAFLGRFQTDKIYPLYHPQRWLGYLATAFILWGTTDVILRRIRRRHGTARKEGPVTLPLLLWLTAVSGIAIHVLRLLGMALTAHYAYAAHLVILVPMVVVEVPFGEWAHMIDRPLALYFQAVRERAREEVPMEAGLAPVRA